MLTVTTWMVMLAFKIRQPFFFPTPRPTQLLRNRHYLKHPVLCYCSWQWQASKYRKSPLLSYNLHHTILEVSLSYIPIDIQRTAIGRLASFSNLFMGCERGWGDCAPKRTSHTRKRRSAKSGVSKRPAYYPHTHNNKQWTLVDDTTLVQCIGILKVTRFTNFLVCFIVVYSIR